MDMAVLTSYRHALPPVVVDAVPVMVLSEGHLQWHACLNFIRVSVCHVEYDSATLLEISRCNGRRGVYAGCQIVMREGIEGSFSIGKSIGLKVVLCLADDADTLRRGLWRPAFLASNAMQGKAPSH